VFGIIRGQLMDLQNAAIAVIGPSRAASAPPSAKKKQRIVLGARQNRA
jgi:hypothetical protein